MLLGHSSLSSCLLTFLLLCFLAFSLPFFFVRFLEALPSSRMSSFLSDSAIGLGDSDSRGLIEQPIMDQKVISIGGSLSKDTHRGASDGESSSSERVRASRRAGWGVSRPHGRA